MMPARMRGILRFVSWAALGFLVVACTGEGAPLAGGPTRIARTKGSAVALSADERVAVTTNRTSGVVTVFSLDPRAGAENMVKRRIELDVGASSEPWAAVVGADDDTAYVVLRQAQTLIRIKNLRSTPVVDGVIDVGSEPTAIAISPTGERLFVANFGDGTVSMVPAQNFDTGEQRTAKVDLNAALAETGVLGSVAPRPALAHPHALVVTDDGDQEDDDETLYVTEFFSQPLTGVPEEADFGHVDKNRQGFVYGISVETGQVEATIPIAPVLETGFRDGEGRMTSCFPNQLYSLALDRGRLYVTSFCTSPRGPVGPRDVNGEPTAANFKTALHPALFVIDTSANLELPEFGSLLTRKLSAYYEAGESDAEARMPLIPADVAFAESPGGGSRAYVSARGADAVFRVEFDSVGLLSDIGSPEARYIDLASPQGLPVGVAASNTSSPPFVLVLNEGSQKLSIVDVESERAFVQKISPDTPRAVEVSSSAENRGRQFFASGLDIWSYEGQAWNSCESCHPGGASDGVTWFFSRGPRRTLSTLNTYYDEPGSDARVRRLMLWGANIDEVHDIEAIVRTVSGGAGAVLWTYAAARPNNDCRLLYDGSVPNPSGTEPCLAPKVTTLLHNGLNGSLSSIVTEDSCRSDATVCDTNAAADWNDIDSFIRSLRKPHRPSNLSSALVGQGREVFRRGGCAGCHGGPGWTLSKVFYDVGTAANGALPYDPGGSESLELGSLRTELYRAPSELAFLNPVTAERGAPLRSFSPTDDSAAAAAAHAYDSRAQGDEQIQCALRAVGTFPPSSDAGSPSAGVVAPGAPSIAELRQDMKSPAQGQNGFNVPSLFGLGASAPYLHAGNARTLEELFSETFGAHAGALNPDFELEDSELEALVAFLLSIDERSDPESFEYLGEDGEPLDLDFCE